MRKADLVARIAEKTEIPKVDVLMTLETFFQEVKDSIANNENVYIRGFGSFVTKKRAKKIGRNIKAGKAMEIPAHYIPAFKPAKIFMEKVKEEVKVEVEEAKEKAKAKGKQAKGKQAKAKQ